MQPTYITKKEMIEKFGYPYFGFTVTRTGSDPKYRQLGVWVCTDLPVRVQISVRAHEMQHWNDHAFTDGRIWYWEVRAWYAGFKADRRGFFQGIWLSITDKERVALYWKRFKKNF